MIKLIINDKVFNPSCEDELQHLLDNSVSNNFLEIWIEGYGESALCLMTNRTKAFLMYLRYKGDCGYSSRDSSGDNENTIDFKLSNGQTDSYPENWTVDKKLGIESMIEYFRTGERSKNIDWEYDGQ